MQPMIETNNQLSNPEDQFLVGEGTYVLKEDLHLATPPPHPSEAPVINPNPLATTPQKYRIVDSGPSSIDSSGLPPGDW